MSIMEFGPPALDPWPERLPAPSPLPMLLGFLFLTMKERTDTEVFPYKKTILSNLA